MLVRVFSLILVHRCARGGKFSAGYLILERLSMLLIMPKHKGNTRRNQVRSTLRLAALEEVETTMARYRVTSSAWEVQLFKFITFVTMAGEDKRSLFLIYQYLCVLNSPQRVAMQLGMDQDLHDRGFIVPPRSDQASFSGRYIKVVANHLRTVIVNAGEDIYERIVSISRELGDTPCPKVLISQWCIRGQRCRIRCVPFPQSALGYPQSADEGGSCYAG